MNPIGGQANTRYRTLVKRADGSPITTGTVNYYLVAIGGTNDGKWFRNSDDSWQASETAVGTMTHKADGQWKISVNSAAWIPRQEYREYAKESTDLHVPTGATIRATADLGIYGSVNDAAPNGAGFTLSSDFPATTDALEGMILVFTSGSLKGLNRRISSYDATRKCLFTGSPDEPDGAFPSAPANGDLLMVLGRIA